MQLRRLKIDRFRNLQDFEIAFTPSVTDDHGREFDFRSYAIIGQNGSGKSNMIEAIVTIFRDLDLNYPASFAYELDYESPRKRGLRCRRHRGRAKRHSHGLRWSITQNRVVGAVRLP